MAGFLIAKGEIGELWACVDPDALCIDPNVAPRRFAAYLSPFESEEAARRALLDAGADPSTIAAEQRPRRCRGRR